VEDAAERNLKVKTFAAEISSGFQINFRKAVSGNWIHNPAENIRTDNCQA
jgi:hypothetical protein